MVTVGLSKAKLRECLHRDVRLMLAFYLGDKLDLEIPDMHVEIWDELIELLDQVNDPSFLIGKLRKLLAIPRGHAKTTLIKLAVLVFLRYSPLRFCAYMSNTAPIAFNAILDIIAYIEQEGDSSLFGESRTVRKVTQEHLFIIDLAVPNSTEPKRVIIKGFGQDTQVRGAVINDQRPDLIVFDDIESREIVESELRQRRLDAWAMGTAMKSMAAKGVIIFIGNMLSKTSLLARLAKDPKWNATVLGSIVKKADGTYESLWPSLWPLDALLEDYRDYIRTGQAHIWEAEMMNLTSDEILGLNLDTAWRPSDPLPEEIDAAFMVLDPAFGEKAWHDYSAITVHVRRKPFYDANGHYVHEPPILTRVITLKGQPELLFDTMLAEAYYWGIATWMIEAVAAQKLLISLFKIYALARGIQPGVLFFMPILGGKVAKSNRIAAFRAAVANGSYGVSESLPEFITKLEQYTPLLSEHDDDLDSAAFGLQAWAENGNLIESRGAGKFVMGQLLPDMASVGSHVDNSYRIP